jgi:hypothetical protein
MSRLLSAFILLTVLPLIDAAAVEPVAGTESGPAGAGPPGYQAWPGHQLSAAEQAPEKHIAAAAAHEQAATHHKAAAAALQSGKTEQVKEHAIAAEKAAAEAFERSREALMGAKPK